MMRQQGAAEGKPEKPSKPARPPRASGRAAPDDGRKRSAYDDEDDGDEVTYDHRSSANTNRRYGDYEDEDDDEDEYYDRRGKSGAGKGGRSRDKWEDDRDARRNTKDRSPKRRDYDDFEEEEWESEERPSRQMVSMNPSVGSRDKVSPRKAPFRLDLSDMKKFLTTPLPKDAGTVQCQIRRNRDGTNKLHPTYTLYLKQDDVFLMNAKKRPNNRTSNYLLSMGQNDMNREGPNYLGKLRSNFIGTEFQIFDHGYNPKDQPEFPGQTPRKEMGGVIYAANVLGHKGPRKMQVALPSLDDHSQIVHSNGGDNDLIRKIKDHECVNSTTYLINKPPRWNDQVGAYVLNFQGRVTMASVKNFQLVDPDAQDTVVLQFGRVGKEDFTMDMHHPITPLQAFAVTLSSFDSKIACD
jgi:tubby-related protein 1